MKQIIKVIFFFFLFSLFFISIHELVHYTINQQTGCSNQKLEINYKAVSITCTDNYSWAIKYEQQRKTFNLINEFTYYIPLILGFIWLSNNK